METRAVYWSPMCRGFFATCVIAAFAPLANSCLISRIDLACQESRGDVLLEKFQQNKKFEKAKLEDVLLWLHKDLTVFFIVDVEEFEIVGIKNIRERSISLDLRKGTKLSEILKVIGKDIGGQFKWDADRDIRLAPIKTQKTVDIVSNLPQSASISGPSGSIPVDD